MNNELKVTLKKELQKAKLENEALQEENERFKELIDSLSQRNKKLESQILINLEMYQNENKKRDEDIEFLLLAFSEMKNREAKEFDYIYNIVNGLSENFEKVHNDLNNK
jgi:chromosome segregation ATPase